MEHNFSLEHPSSQAEAFYTLMQDLLDRETLLGAWKELYLKTLPGLALAVMLRRRNGR
jgi:hypothetical protein